MLRYFRYVLLGLVLVTVFLVSALMAMRFAIHGREAAVPKVIGMTTAEARRSAAATGLLLEVENRFYSPDIPEGRVVSQAPAPGTEVRRGWKIRVAESLGPQRVAIPSIIGQSRRAAEINLAQRGLQLGNVATVSLANIPPEQIIAQSPPPNAQGVASPKVNLLMTAPAGEAKPQLFVMADFVGKTFVTASDTLKQSGFKLGPVTVIVSGPPANDKTFKPRPLPGDIVVAQRPLAGQKIAAGSTIGFQVMR
jgi:beta-lactam-binding protein with PASTA domain